MVDYPDFASYKVSRYGTIKVEKSRQWVLDGALVKYIDLETAGMCFMIHMYNEAETSVTDLAFQIGFDTYGGFSQSASWMLANGWHNIPNFAWLLSTFNLEIGQIAVMSCAPFYFEERLRVYVEFSLTGSLWGNVEVWYYDLDL